MSRYVDIDSEFLKEWLRTETKKAMQRTEALIEGKYLAYSPEGLNDLINEILGLMPEVDVVEVVRCKDCKHLKGNNGYDRPWCGKLEWLYLITKKPDDYCSHGERREDVRESN